MLPVLSAAFDGELRVRDLVDRLSSKLNLTPEEQAELLPSGQQTVFSNRVHWAKTYLSKAGLLEITRRGYFKITPRGQEVLASKPERINVRFLDQFREFQEFKERSRLAQGAEKVHDLAAHANDREMPAEPPNEIMLAAHRQIESALAQDLLDRIRSAPPDFFERLIVNLLLSMGFGGSSAEAGRALGRSGDDGVDGVIDQDAYWASTEFTFRRNATLRETPSALTRYGSSSVASICTRRPRASLSQLQIFRLPQQGQRNPLAKGLY
jgi:restriction system protein